MKYYAGYRTQNTDVAFFNTKEERDSWVKDEGIFPRVALTEKDVMKILGNPANVESFSDFLESNVTWLVNPHNVVVDGVTYSSFEVLVTA